MTCTMPFYIDDGVATATGTGISVPFNFSSAPGSLIGGKFGGDQTCGSAGCSDNLFSLTFQSADRAESFSTGPCEIVETPQKCAIEGDRGHPIPASPAMPMVTAKLTCKNTLIPCGGFKATADIDFHADVAWPEPPPPSPSPPLPISPPPEPVSPPPSPPSPPAAPPPPATFAPGGSGTRALLGFLYAALLLVAAYAVLGYAYTWLLVRDRLPRVLDDTLRRFTPYRCEEELAAGVDTSAAGAGRGSGVCSAMRPECELLWCWCIPVYWRFSQRDVMDAYWAYHPMDDDDNINDLDTI